MTLADEIAVDIRAIRRDVERIAPLSRVRPHVFAEQKDELARRLDQLETKIRNGFGGPPGQFKPGSIVDRNGRLIRVERRRGAA